jgi:hypothetical protein
LNPDANEFVFDDRLINLKRSWHYRLQSVEIGPVLDDEIFPLTESIRSSRKGGAGQWHRKRTLSHLGFFHCYPFCGENAAVYFARGNSPPGSVAYTKKASRALVNSLGDTIANWPKKFPAHMSGDVQRRSRTSPP